MLGFAGLLAVFAIYRDRVRPAILMPLIVAVAAAPVFFVQLATAYADVPLAIFVASGAAAATRWLVDRHTAWLALAVVFFAAATLTKNEGLLYTVAALIGLMVVARGRRFHVVAAAVVLGLVALPWRLHVRADSIGRGGSGDYDLGRPVGSGSIDDRLSRAAEAARGLLGYVTETGRVGILLPLAVALAVVAVIVGRRDVGGFVLIFVTVALAGLTWVYTISPLELEGYLRLSADRVTTGVVLGAAATVPMLVECLGVSRRRARTPQRESSSE